MQFSTGKCKIDLKQKKQTRECVLNETIIQMLTRKWKGGAIIKHKSWQLIAYG